MTRPHRVRNTLLAALVAAVVLLGRPGSAHAYATPVSYEPAASSVSAEAPQRVMIRFNEPVEPAASSMRVYAPDGSRAELGAAAIDGTDARLFFVPFGSEAEGTYSVSWQVVSADDGHFTKGAFSFSIGKETATASETVQGFQISHSSPTPEALTIWLELIGHAALVGVLACLAFVWRPLRRRGAPMDEVAFVRAADRLVIIADVLGILGAVAGFAVKSEELAVAQSVPFLVGAANYAATVSGSFVIVRAASLAMFLAIYGRSRRAMFTASRPGVVERTQWLLLLIDALARARVSHAAASHLLPHVSIAINFLHLLAKDLWVGGAIAMAFVIVPALGGVRAALARAAGLWSRVAAAAIGAAGITGAYVVWLHLKSPAYLFSTDWGGRCLLLALVGSVMFAVRSWQALKAEPALAEAHEGSDVSYKDGMRLEAWLGSLLLLVTAFIIITTPPLDARPAMAKSAVSEGLRLTLTETAFDRTSLLVVAEDADDGRPASLEDMVITLENRALGIGPLVVPVTRRWTGAYSFDEKLLSASGDWRVDVTAHKTGGHDATTAFTLAIPSELEEGRAKAETRADDGFNAFMAMTSAFFAAVGYVLWRRAAVTLRRAADGRRTTEQHERPVRAVSPALAVALFAPLLFYGARISVLKGPFQHFCEASGHLWTQTVPMAAGIAKSPLAISGCSLGSGAGAYHFADAREYAHFVRIDDPVLIRQESSETIIAGKPTIMKIAVTEGSAPATDLVIEHDRLMHVVVVSRDFRTYAHLHVEDNGPVTEEMRRTGVYPVAYTFPEAGTYLVAVDIAVRSRKYSDHFIIHVAGEGTMGPGSITPTQEADADGFKVRLDTMPKKLWSRRDSRLRFVVERDGKPVTDLQPYLGAAMHIGLVWNDFDRSRVSGTGPSAAPWYATAFVRAASAHGIMAPNGGTVALPDLVHLHGEPSRPWFSALLTGKSHTSPHKQHVLPEAFGPAVDADVTFPASGFYVLFAEFKHGGKVHVAKFVVEVFDGGL